MDAQVLAKKRAEVRSETQNLAASLAKKLGVEVSSETFNVRARDPRVQALRQEESIRDFLSELDSSVKSSPRKSKKSDNE